MGDDGEGLSAEIAGVKEDDDLTDENADGDEPVDYDDDVAPAEAKKVLVEQPAVARPPPKVPSPRHKAVRRPRVPSFGARPLYTAGLVFALLLLTTYARLSRCQKDKLGSTRGLIRKTLLGNVLLIGQSRELRTSRCIAGPGPLAQPSPMSAPHRNFLS